MTNVCFKVVFGFILWDWDLNFAIKLKCTLLISQSTIVSSQHAHHSQDSQANKLIVFGRRGGGGGFCHSDR